MSEHAIILLADDNGEDVTLTQRALRTAGLGNKVHVVGTGQEVIEYLTGALHARTLGASIPLLILLDLDLPDLTGFEVLEWIRTKKALHGVPVVVYTGSIKASHASRAKQLGANSYWVKPSSFKNLVTLMELLKVKIVSLEDRVRSAGEALSGKGASRRGAALARKADDTKAAAQPPPQLRPGIRLRHPGRTSPAAGR
jgi:CheY-like chemotaxis protein